MNHASPFGFEEDTTAFVGHVFNPSLSVIHGRLRLESALALNLHDIGWVGRAHMLHGHDEFRPARLGSRRW